MSTKATEPATSETSQDDAMMTTKEVCDFLQVTYHTVHRWRRAGIGPKYYRIGGSIRYFRRDVIDFVHSTDAAAVRTRGVGRP